MTGAMPRTQRRRQSPLATTAFRVVKGVADNGPVLRFGAQIVIDAIAWIVAIFSAGVLRYELHIERIDGVWFTLVTLAAVVTQVCVGLLFRLYRGRHPYGSFAEMLAVFTAVGVTVAVVGIPVLLMGNAIGVPRSTLLIAGPIALFLMGAVRYIKRLIVDTAGRPDGGSEPTLVYGAGETGTSLVRWMWTTGSRYLPVGLIDDNPARRRAWFHGVRVLGTGEQLTEIARATGATTLVVAIARADAQMLRKIADFSKPSGLKVHVLPHFDEIIAGRSRLQDLRDLSIDDLIGRHPVDMQIESVAGYLAGKRILVTGAGGSIGSELCRQITRYGPGELIMLDRDETGLQQTQLSVQGNGLLDDDSVVLADIRDAERITTLLAERRPEVVFHAAALKHLPMLEMYPDEAWKTNVIGTRNMLDAALAAGVQTFINISTDKAVLPTSVLGHSKRVAEQLTAGVAARTGLRYLSVRFGNVLGSRGSLVPTFTSLIESGGPLTVTHPDATRFFMTIPEACQLVLQAGAIGRGGDALMLDMGEPVRILDIANRMIEMSQKDVAIVFTGLRRGEKLHEVLLGENEHAQHTSHPQITCTRIDGIDPGDLAEVGETWQVAVGATDETTA
jgi:FlaA1/EpsC-like NDP-sugar epimerase